MPLEELFVTIGPENSFSDIHIKTQHNPKKGNIIYEDTISGVFRLYREQLAIAKPPILPLREHKKGVRSGDTTQALEAEPVIKIPTLLVPIENSTKGDVAQTLELILSLHKDQGVVITSGTVDVIDLAIGGLSPSLDKLTRVFTKPEAAAQCKKLLTEFPNIQVDPNDKSTSAAIAMILGDKEKYATAAAIAHPLAFKNTGLTVYRENIGDLGKNNRTLFLKLQKPVKARPKIGKGFKTVIAITDVYRALGGNSRVVDDIFNRSGVRWTDSYMRTTGGGTSTKFYEVLVNPTLPKQIPQLIENLKVKLHGYEIYHLGTFPCMELYPRQLKRMSMLGAGTEMVDLLRSFLATEMQIVGEVADEPTDEVTDDLRNELVKVRKKVKARIPAPTIDESKVVPDDGKTVTKNDISRAKAEAWDMLINLDPVVQYVSERLKSRGSTIAILHDIMKPTGRIKVTGADAIYFAHHWQKREYDEIKSVAPGLYNNALILMDEKTLTGMNDNYRKLFEEGKFEAFFPVIKKLQTNKVDVPEGLEGYLIKRMQHVTAGSSEAVARQIAVEDTNSLEFVGIRFLGDRADIGSYNVIITPYDAIDPWSKLSEFLGLFRRAGVETNVISAEKHDLVLGMQRMVGPIISYIYHCIRDSLGLSHAEVRAASGQMHRLYLDSIATILGQPEKTVTDMLNSGVREQVLKTFVESTLIFYLRTAHTKEGGRLLTDLNYLTKGKKERAPMAISGASTGETNVTELTRQVFQLYTSHFANKK